MDDSDPMHDVTTPAPSQASVMGRAMLSAVVFGAIGALFGRWLGERGNAPKSEMAKPMMKWGMGGFWALLAAYASLKSSQRVEDYAPPAPAVPQAPAADQSMPHSIADVANAPSTRVNAATSAHAGELAVAHLSPLR